MMDCFLDGILTETKNNYSPRLGGKAVIRVSTCGVCGENYELRTDEWGIYYSLCPRCREKPGVQAKLKVKPVSPLKDR